MTVVNGTIHLPFPVPAEELVHIATEGLRMTQEVLSEQGGEAWAETVLPLTADRMMVACRLCIDPQELRGCRAKVAWANKVTGAADASPVEH